MTAPERRHIALIGFMGCGKTTVGKLLAQSLGRAIIDTDRLVETTVGKPIPTIFSSEGEAAFRQYESEALLRALQRPPAVIATGGGLVVRDENWSLLSCHAITVWLRVPFEVLAQRLQGNTDRPLVRDDPGLRRTRSLYTGREPRYREADIWVDATAVPHQVVEAIVQRLPRGFK